MNGFRQKFEFPRLTSVNWFPGHMAKGQFLRLVSLVAIDIHDPLAGLRVISQRMEQCDCVVEVHDARVSSMI